MPNKYEREIEEILRNLERTEPKARFGQRVSGRIRRKAGPRRSLSLPQLSASEWFLVIACVTALAAGGWVQSQHDLGNAITGAIALISVACIMLVAISNFVGRPRYQSSSARYNNVTPIRRNPLRRVVTSWQLLMLKLRYRNKSDRER